MNLQCIEYTVNVNRLSILKPATPPFLHRYEKKKIVFIKNIDKRLATVVSVLILIFYET